MEPAVLKSLERLYITTVLDDCLDQMSTLSHLQLPSRDRDFSPEEGLNTMTDKDIEELQNNRKENECLHVWQKETTNVDRPTILLNALIAMIWDKMMLFKKLSKIGRDHQLPELLIIAIRDEIAKKGTFSCMTLVISDHKLRKKSERIIDLTFVTAKRVAELCQQREQLVQECDEDGATHAEIVGVLKISKETLQYRARYKFTREKKFCDAHEEQEGKKMVISNSDLVEELNSIENAQNLEPKLTKTISAFLSKRLAEREGMLEYWMERYETQLEEKQKRLENVKFTRSRQWDSTFNLIQRYSNYVNIVDDYNREKLEAELRASVVQRKSIAAVKIESWWRGIMVQKKLGPFRPKRPGKGDKKGKK